MDSAYGLMAGRGAIARATSFDKRRLGLVAAVLLLLATAAAMSLATVGRTALAGAAVERAKDLLELIEQRSPGQRTQGQLVKTKHRLAPHERALPKVRQDVPWVPIEQPPLALIDIVSAPPVVPVGLDKIATVEEIVPPGSSSGPPVVGGPPGGPGLVVPPGSPGQSPPSSPPIVSSPPPVPPVPEPATWMTMLLGFAAIGWRLRGRRAPAAPLAGR